MSDPPRRFLSLKLVAAWTLVAIPLGWGVAQSVVKSLPLFRAAPARPAPGPLKVDPGSGPSPGGAQAQSPRDAQ